MLSLSVPTLTDSSISDIMVEEDDSVEDENSEDDYVEDENSFISDVGELNSDESDGLDYVEDDVAVNDIHRELRELDFGDGRSLIY
jgi:hypothetical protein